MPLPSTTDLDQFVSDSMYLSQRIRIANRAKDLPVSARFDLARSPLDDEELEAVTREFGAPDRNGWGFSSLLEDLLSKDPRSVATGDLKTLQKNLRDSGYVNPDTPIDGMWSPVWNSGFGRFDQDNREEAISGGHWTATTAQKGANLLGQVLPTGMFKSLVGQAKAIVTEAPETGERLGAVGGAIAGAAIGASIGSVIPGVGTLAVGGVGAVIGGAAGFFADLFGGAEGEEDQGALMSLVDPLVPNEYFTEKQGAQKFWQDVGYVSTVATIPQAAGFAARGIGAAAALAKTPALGSATAKMTGWLGTSGAVTPQPAWWIRWMKGAPSLGKTVSPGLKTVKGAISGAVVGTTAQTVEAMTTGMTDEWSLGDVARFAGASAVVGAVLPWMKPGSLAWLERINLAKGVMALKQTNPLVKSVFASNTALASQSIWGYGMAGIASGDHRTPMEKAIQETPELPEWVNLIGFAVFPERFLPFKVGDITNGINKSRLLGDHQLSGLVSGWMATHPGTTSQQAKAQMLEAFGADEAEQTLSLLDFRMRKAIHEEAVERTVRAGHTREGSDFFSQVEKHRYAIQRELEEGFSEGTNLESVARELVDERSELKSLTAIQPQLHAVENDRGTFLKQIFDDRANALLEKARNKVVSPSFANKGEGGFTLDLATGQFFDAGTEQVKDLYSVAMLHGQGTKGKLGRPDASIIQDAEAFKAHVQDVITKNYDLLQQKNAMLGGWVYEGKLYIEPIELIRGQEKALNAASLRGMKAATSMETLDDFVVPDRLTRPSLIGELMTKANNPVTDEAYLVYLHNQGSAIDGITAWKRADELSLDVQRQVQERRFDFATDPGYQRPANARRTELEAESKALDKQIKKLRDSSLVSGLDPETATMTQERIFQIERTQDDIANEIKQLKKLEKRDWTSAKIIPMRTDTPTRSQLRTLATEYRELRENLLTAEFVGRDTGAARATRTELDAWVQKQVDSGILTDSWAARARRPEPDIEVGQHIRDMSKGAAEEVTLPDDFMARFSELGYKPVLAGGEVIRPTNISRFAWASGVGDFSRRRNFWESLGLGLSTNRDKDLLKLRALYQENELQDVAKKYNLPLSGKDVMRRITTALHELRQGRSVSNQNVLKALGATPRDIGGVPPWGVSKHGFITLDNGQKIIPPLDVRDIGVEQIAAALDDVVPGGLEDRVAKEMFAAVKRGGAFGGEWAPLRAPRETARALGHNMRLNGLAGFQDLIRTFHSETGRVVKVDVARKQILAYSPEPELVSLESRQNVERLHTELGAARGWDAAESKLAMMALDDIARGAVASNPEKFPTLSSFYDSLDVRAVDDFAALSGEAGWQLQTKRVADEYPEIFEGWQSVDIPGASPHMLPTVDDLMKSAKRGAPGRFFYEEGQHVAAYHLSHGYTQLPGGEVRIKLGNAAEARDAAAEVSGKNGAVAIAEKNELVVKIPPRQISNFELFTNFVAPTSARTPTGVAYRNALDGVIAAQTGNWEPYAAHMSGFEFPASADAYLKQAMGVQISAMRDIHTGFTADMWPRAVQDRRWKTYNFYRNHMEGLVPPSEGIGRLQVEDDGTEIVLGWHATYSKDWAGDVSKGPVHFGTQKSARARVSGSQSKPYANIDSRGTPRGYFDTLADAERNAAENGLRAVDTNDIQMIPLQVRGKFLGSRKPVEDFTANLIADGSPGKMVWDDIEDKWIDAYEAKRKYDGIIYENQIEGTGDLSVVVFEGKKLVRSKTFTEEAFGWTGDVHTYRRFGWEGQIDKTDKVDALFFNAVDELVQETAKRMGWSPKQVQAALWRDMREWTVEMAGRAERAGNTSLSKQFKKWSSGFADERNFAETMAAEYKPRLEFLQEAMKAREEIDGTAYGFVQLQRVEDEVLGAMKFGPDFQSSVRFFRSADAGTLLHEYGHLLRRVLPEDQMQTIAKHLKIDLSKPLAASDEEKFVDLVTKYFANKKAAAKLATPLEGLRRSLGERWARFRNYAHDKGMIHPETQAVLDGWFADSLPKSSAGKTLRPGAKNLILGAATGGAVGFVEGYDMGDIVTGALAGAAVGKGVRFVVNRNYGYLPEYLMKLNSAIRFTLSPVFDAQRLLEQNTLAGSRGLPMFWHSDRAIKNRQWDSVFGTGTVTGDDAMGEAIRLFDRLHGTERAGGARMADDLDRLFSNQGVLGYSPIKRQVAMSYMLKQQGMADDKILETLDWVFHYGAGRSSLEKSANFILFPFSYQKKFITSLADYMLQEPARALLVYEGVQRYYEAGYDDEVRSFLEDHAPLLQQLKVLNSLSYGIGPGRFFLKGLWDHRTGSAKAAQALASFLVPGGVGTPLASSIGQTMDLAVNAFTPIVFTGESIARGGYDTDSVVDIVGQYTPFIKDLNRFWDSAADQWTAVTEGESRWSQLRDYTDGTRQIKSEMTKLARAFGYTSAEGFLQSDIGAAYAQSYESDRMELANEFPTGFEMSQTFENTASLDAKAMSEIASKQDRSEAEEAILELEEVFQRTQSSLSMAGLDASTINQILTPQMRNQAAQHVGDRRFVELWDRFYSYRFGPIRRVA